MHDVVTGERGTHRFLDRVLPSVGPGGLQIFTIDVYRHTLPKSLR